MQSDPQQKSRRNIEYKPHKYLGNTNPGWLQASASQPSDLYWKAFLILILRVGTSLLNLSILDVPFPVLL
jgi:hypothetical protein